MISMTKICCYRYHHHLNVTIYAYLQCSQQYQQLNVTRIWNRLKAISYIC